MKAYEIAKDYKPIEIPWEVRRFFPDHFNPLQIYGDQISFGGDFGNIEEVRIALDWLVEQLGGRAKWKILTKKK